jgi:hypothetical protein
MPDRVGVDLPPVAPGSDEVLPQRRAELDDAALFRLDFAHFEVEVVLLGVFAVGPARRAVMPAKLPELPSMMARPVTWE